MTETEWDSLSALWTSSQENIDAAPLRKLVAAHRRRLLLVTLGEVATLAVLGWLTYVVLRDGVAAWELVWALTLWGFAAIALAFVTWNRRGTWRTLGEGIAEHVRLTRMRAERQRTSLRFVAGLFVAEAVAVVAQLAWFDRLTPRTFALLAASAAIVAVWVVMGRRRIARELKVVEEFERDS